MTPSSLSPPAPRSLNTLQPLLSPTHVLLQPPPRSRTRNLICIHTFRKKSSPGGGVGGGLAGGLGHVIVACISFSVRPQHTTAWPLIDLHSSALDLPHHQPLQLLGRPVRTYYKRMIANAFPHYALLSLRPFVPVITCSALPTSLFSIPRSLQLPLPRPACSCLISLDIRIPLYRYFLPGP